MRDGIGSTSRDNLSGSRRVALTLFQHATLNLFELARAHDLGPRLVVKERWRQIDRHKVAELRHCRLRWLLGLCFQLVFCQVAMAAKH